MIGLLQFNLQTAFSDNNFFQCSDNNVVKISKFLTTVELINFIQCSKNLKDRLFDCVQERQYDKFVKSIEQIRKRKATYLQQKKIKLQDIQDKYKLVKIQYFDLPKYVFQTNIFQQIKGIDQLDGTDFKIDSNNNFIFQFKDQILVMNRSLIDEKLFFEKLIQEESQSQKYQDFYNDFDESKITDMQTILRRQKKILNKIQKNEELEEAKKKKPLEYLQEQNMITIILCYGGNFSIGVYNKEENIFHKSDHKYVCRKKQGQRQLTKDKSNQAQSMGSQMRRGNEVKHQANIQHILNGCEHYLNNSYLIFIQAPGFNKLILLQQNLILANNKHKLKSLSLTSKKANYSEVDRIYKHISRVMILQKQ